MDTVDKRLEEETVLAGESGKDGPFGLCFLHPSFFFETEFDITVCIFLLPQISSSIIKRKG